MIETGVLISCSEIQDEAGELWVGRREVGGRMIRAQTQRRALVNLSLEADRTSPPWTASHHPEMRDMACTGGARSRQRVGLGKFNQSISPPELLEDARQGLNDLPDVYI